jgi:hypothetical protein
MQQIVIKELDGTINIFDSYDISAPIGLIDSTPIFINIGDEFILSISNIQNLIKFNKFNFEALGITENRLLKTYYRISRDGNKWTDWLDLNSYFDNFPVIDPMESFFIDIKWIRDGDSKIGTIKLIEYNISGKIDRNEVQGDETYLVKSNDKLVIKPPFVYKVFSLSDIEIISSDLTDVVIKYRISQDNSRSWSNWEFFTKENISTLKISPIRFFQIEYSIENNSSNNFKIYDINLIGDFQNVSKDYFKTNLFGIRECCQSNILGGCDDGGLGVGCDNDGVNRQLTEEDKKNFFNPYQQNKAIELLSKLTSDAEQIFGHRVLYFATDADKKGQDHILHEYQLYNVVCDGEIKVSVEGNNFPDSQIVMNQFDLNLFETMEVHITKEQFKKTFGPQRRPSKEDFLYFCDLNRMYQVEHAQQFRSFNNAAVYYKLILKKYSQKANVQAGNSTIAEKISQLTKNSTIDELFGIEQSQDKAAVANKDQFKPLTKDPIRMDYYATIDKELIENGSTIISKSNYDLSSVDFLKTAVKYKNIDPVLKVSDNIGYMLWFNIHNYISNEVYNFFDYYDETNSLGWKVQLINDSISVKVNSDEYIYNLTGNITSGVEALEEDTWYCYVLNIDQRNRKLEQYVYKRNVDDEEDAPQLISTKLRLVYEDIQEYVPVSFELESISGQLIGSDMKVTNIRLFLDVLNKDSHTKILNQYVLGDDSKYLIFADNATTRLYLPNMPLG